MGVVCVCRFYRKNVFKRCHQKVRLGLGGLVCKKSILLHKEPFFGKMY